MSGSARPAGAGTTASGGRRRGLLLRFLLILTPLFLVLAVPGVGGLVVYVLHKDKEALAVRFGNHAGRVAAALARHDPAANRALAQDLVSTLASDRALICAELYRGEGANKPVVTQPPGIGCRDRPDGIGLEIPVGDEASYMLKIRFSDAEIREAEHLQLIVAVGVIALSFVLALLTSTICFRIIVGRPLGLLLRAIEKSSSADERPLVGVRRNDELGTVITAFNEMQLRDIEREQALTVANEELRKSQAELEAWNSELEHAVGERTRELEAALIRAEAANRSMSQFLASMSHELRTPLNSIIGFSELMQRQILGPLGSDRYVEFTGDIHSSGKHLLKIVNEILDLAKIEAGTVQLWEEVEEARSLTESCLRLVGPAAEARDISLTFRLEDEGMLLSVDTTRFRQALINLLSNAIKFTPEGGAVSLATGRDGFGGMTFVVADTGIGMRPEDIPTALAAFGQVDRTLARKFEGTGLGLPLAKQFIELHGGELHIESAPGKGTRVTLRLPPHRVLSPARTREPRASGTG